MSFCENCGNEIGDGSKFCPNCGAKVERAAVANGAAVEKRAVVVKRVSQGEAKSVPTNVPRSAPQNVKVVTGKRQDTYREWPKEKEESVIDRFGKFYGIALLLLSFVDFYSDPALLTIILSIVLISGCIFCFYKKYKLIGFTIAALIVSIFCLLSGVIQAKLVGLVKMPQSIEESVNDMTTQASGGKTSVAPAQRATEAPKVSSSNTSGVNPDLVEFLDSYEKFIDEYVDFMQNFSEDSVDGLAMMSDYLQLMNTLAEYNETIDKIDTSNMSKADEKYYLEVLNRCNMKMIDAAIDVQ